VVHHLGHQHLHGQAVIDADKEAGDGLHGNTSYTNGLKPKCHLNNIERFGNLQYQRNASFLPLAVQRYAVAFGVAYHGHLPDTLADFKRLGGDLAACGHYTCQYLGQLVTCIDVH